METRPVQQTAVASPGISRAAIILVGAFFVCAAFVTAQAPGTVPGTPTKLLQESEGLVDLAKWNIERHFDGLTFTGVAVPGFLAGAHYLREYLGSPVRRFTVIMAWLTLMAILAATVIGNLDLHNAVVAELERRNNNTRLVGLAQVSLAPSIAAFSIATASVAFIIGWVMKPKPAPSPAPDPR